MVLINTKIAIVSHLKECSFGSSVVLLALKEYTDAANEVVKRKGETTEKLEVTMQTLMQPI